MNTRLHRTQLFLDSEQIKLLTRLAKQQKRTMKELASEAISLGLQSLAHPGDAQWRRATVLQRAKRLRQTMRANHGGRPLPIDCTQLIGEMREERDNAIVRIGSH
jgi:hypothetical protein